MTKHVDHAAFLKKAEEASFRYAKRDAGASIEDIREVQEKILVAVEDIKAKNDAMQAEAKKRGSEDIVAREQVERITEEIKELKEIREQIDALKVKMSRPGALGNGDARA